MSQLVATNIDGRLRHLIRRVGGFDRKRKLVTVVLCFKSL